MTKISTKLSNQSKKGWETRKAKELAQAEELESLKERLTKANEKIESLILEKQSEKPKEKFVVGQAVDFSKKTEQLNKEKAAFLADWEKRFNENKTEMLK